MLMFTCLTVINSSILLILVTLMILLFKKSHLQMEKNSPFECGFEPMESARIPFSIHFFLIGIMFLVFDIEIVLIMPLMLISTLINMKVLLISSFTPIFILLWGLFHEWNYQSLNWTS
uniref:NADH-ubiquinone oxidoreductase chain 3 n=1 Tax=Hackeriella veitchi TaxID=60873 RepID=L7N6J0_9HEMI|nr:NADH dehydrogenase subunit 3 [Hackeriella veitchi]ACV96706.1 NADH dehydrogenase subunit 3 [Hackeriella veitchi]